MEGPVKVFSDVLQQFLEETRELQKLADESGGTKGELKDATKALVRSMFDTEFKWVTVEKELMQAKEQERWKAINGGQQQHGKWVEQAVDNGSFEALEIVFAEKWTEEAFSVTKIGTEAGQGLENGDLALVIESEKVD